MKTSLFKTVVTCLFLFGMLAACNSRQYVIEYKLSEGDTCLQQIEINTDSKQQMSGETLEMKNTIQMVLRSKVIAVHNSATTVNTCYDYIRQTRDMGVMKSDFSSDDTTATATLKNTAPLLKAIKDIPIKLTIDRLGKIGNIDGFDTIYAVWQQKVDVNEPFKKQIIDLVDKDFGLDAFKTTVGRFTSVFPDRPVKIGDSWSITDKHYGSHVITLNGNMKLLRVKNNIATIDYQADISALPADNTIEISGLITYYDLNGMQTGLINVDILNGFIVDADINQALKGIVKMERQKPAALIEIPVELTINIKQNNILHNK